jgi:hypothetical protein
VDPIIGVRLYALNSVISTIQSELIHSLYVAIIDSYKNVGEGGNFTVRLGGGEIGQSPAIHDKAKDLGG